MVLTALTCTAESTGLCILDILCRQSATTVAAKISISLLQFRTFTGLCMMAFVLALQCAHPLGHNDGLKPPNMLSMQTRYPQHQPQDIPNHRCFLNCSRNTTVESRSSSLWNIWTPRLLALLPCRSSSLLNKIVEPGSLWVPYSDTADYLRGPGCLDPFCCAGEQWRLSASVMIRAGLICKRVSGLAAGKR